MNARTLGPARIAALLVAAVTALASGAAAQVATPNLTTLAATTANPAAVSFAPQSFVGASAGQGDARADDAAGLEVASGDTSTEQAHLRLVGDTFAFAADALHTEIKIDQTAAVPFKLHDDGDVLRTNAAVRFGDTLAIGLGGGREKRTGSARAQIPIGIFEREEERTVTLAGAGAVLRLAEVFYVGGAYGNEKIEVDRTDSLNGTPLAPQSFTSERPVRRAGVGVLWLNNDGDAFRLEVSGEKRGDYAEPDPNPALPDSRVDERERRQGDLEVRWNGVLLGVTSAQDEVFDNDVKSREERETGVTIGWVPEQGLAITVAVLRLESEFEAPFPGTSEFDFTLATLHWMF